MMAAGDEDTRSGWGYPTSTARKVHYFRGGRSLCGKYGAFMVELQADNGRPGPDDCVACTRKLRGGNDRG